MARDTVTVTSTIRSGVAPALTTPSAANNAEMANDGRTVFLFMNGLGAASVQATDITIQQVADPYGRTENDAAFTAIVDALAACGPFPPALYNQTDGTVQFDYDAVSAEARVCGLHIAGA